MLTDTVSFKIAFSYKRNNFSATVHRYSFEPVKYLVMIDRPKNMEIEIPSVVSLTVQDETLVSNSSDTDKRLETEIIAAITDHCAIHAIPLSSTAG